MGPMHCASCVWWTAALGNWTHPSWYWIALCDIYCHWHMNYSQAQWSLPHNHVLLATTWKYLSSKEYIKPAFPLPVLSWTQNYLTVPACSILFSFSTSYPACYHLSSWLLESPSQIRLLAQHSRFWLNVFKKVKFRVHLISTGGGTKETWLTTRLGWKRKNNTSGILNSEKKEEIKMSLRVL